MRCREVGGTTGVQAQSTTEPQSAILGLSLCAGVFSRLEEL
jgi:hypothetical protein